ncbi:AAA family ATPase [Nonomuraea glycinis]|uniref:AAA family ATPase n=1 Tax=Nonomuraea glycinis TaxID=2047744 RepID=UPI0033B8FF15
MSNLVFGPPVRAARKARVVVDGPGGSGRTTTALRLARGFGGSVGVIDTDRSAAALYAPHFDFLHLPMTSYAPHQLVEALAVAAEQRIGTVVVDTASPFWSGKGGVISQVDHLTKHTYKGDNNRAWGDVRQAEHDLMDTLLSYPGHVIVTLRVVTDYQVRDGEGRPVTVKYGLKPDQRANFDADFLVSLSLDMTHTATVTKSRVLDVPVGAMYEEPGEELGETIASWLADGVEVPDALAFRDRALDESADADDLRELLRQVTRADLLRAAVLDRNGSVFPLGDLITARGTQMAEVARRAGRQQSRQQPRGQGGEQGSGEQQSAGQQPGGPIGSEFVPEDKQFVADWTHAIAVASTSGSAGEDLATIRVNLLEARGTGEVGERDYTHLFRVLEQRCADLGLPYGQAAGVTT